MVNVGKYHTLSIWKSSNVPYVLLYYNRILYSKWMEMGYVEVSPIDPMMIMGSKDFYKVRTQGTVTRSAAIRPYAPRAQFTILILFLLPKKIVARNAGGVHPRGCVGAKWLLWGLWTREHWRLEPQENYLENQLLFPSTLPLKPATVA